MDPLRPNLVPWRPPGLVIALQYWSGDEARALRLARLIADIEPEHRSDVILVLARRFDCQLSVEAMETVGHCNAKMITWPLLAPFNLCGQMAGEGHPDGANGLWAGTMLALAERWAEGQLSFGAVFLAEADGCPLADNWINRLLKEHGRAGAEGRQVTGPLMRLPFPHINGSMIANLGWFLDHPSLLRTPNGYAWDLHHAGTIVSAARPTQEIKNVYGAKGWIHAQLEPMSNETAWLASTKDESAVAWAEVSITAEARRAGPEGPTTFFTLDAATMKIIGIERGERA